MSRGLRGTLYHEMTASPRHQRMFQRHTIFVETRYVRVRFLLVKLNEAFRLKSVRIWINCRVLVHAGHGDKYDRILFNRISSSVDGESRILSYTTHRETAKFEA